MNISCFTGIGAFGRAYRIMMEKDAHAPGTVDRELARGMVRLCAETAGHLYRGFTLLEARCTAGSRPKLEEALHDICSEHSTPEEVLCAIVEFTRKLGDRAEQDLHEMRIGGTEEEIILRGSDWCTDVARVACALCQVAGFPSRIVYLFNLEQAYSGHVIVEAYRTGIWGALDSSTGVAYAGPDGNPASVWDLMNDPNLIEDHRRDPHAYYTTVGQFRAAGIANYFCWESSRYDYTVSGLNEYYSSILEMSNKGWPGGLRWLHGEDKEGTEQDAALDEDSAALHPRQ